MVDFNINTDDMGSPYSQMQNMSLVQRNSTAVNSHVDATIEEIDHTPSAYEEHQRQQAAARAARAEATEETDKVAEETEAEEADSVEESLQQAGREEFHQVLNESSIDVSDEVSETDIETDTETDIESESVTETETETVNDTENETASDTVNDTETKSDIAHESVTPVEQSTDDTVVDAEKSSMSQSVDNGFARVCTQLPRHTGEAEDAYYLRLYTHVWNEREQLKDSYKRLPSGSPYGEAMFTDIKTTADVLIQIIRAGEKATPRDEFNDPTYDFRAKAQSTHGKPAVKKPAQKPVEKSVAPTEPPAEKKSPEPVKTQIPKSEPARTEPDTQSASAETTKPSAKEKPSEPTSPVASKPEPTSPAAQPHVVSKAETGNAVYVPLADVVSATRAAEYIHYPLEERNMPGEGVDGKLGNTDLTINGLSLNKYIDEGKDVKRNTVQLPSSVMAAVSEHLEKCGYGTGATNNQIVMGALLSILPETHPLISKTQYDENTDLIRRVFGRINLSLDRNTNEIIELREGLVDMMSFVLQLGRILDAQSVTTTTVGELTSWLVAERFDTTVRNQALQGDGVSALNTRDEHVAEYYNKVAQQIMKDRTRAEEERKKKQQEAREQRGHEIQESLKKRADGQVQG